MKFAISLPITPTTKQWNEERNEKYVAHPLGNEADEVRTYCIQEH